MSQNNQLDFSKFGKNFQEKLAQLMFQDRQFADQLREVLDLNFFELKYIQLFCKKLFDYRDKYDMYPSSNIMNTVLRTELEEDNEALNKQVRDFFARILASPEIEDEDYIKDTSLDFCRRQKIKEALVKSAGLMNKSNSLDEIGVIVTSALKLGTDNNYGYDYKLDFEKRFMLKERNPVSTGWDRVDGITQGGLGRGELGVVIAPTGAGKSMALVHLGAMAVKAGLQVVHYTLELSDTVVASRYDACLTGVPLTNLMDEKEMILEEVKNVRGKLIIKEYPTKTASTSVIKNHLKRIASAGQKVDMIIVDYGDLLNPTVRYKEKRTELETIYEELRAIAMEFVCPVWTASQTNRSGLNAEVVTMESISEAFNKCFVADFIFSVSRTVDDKKTNSGRIFIAKNRNGPDGIVMPLYMDTSVVKMEVLEDAKPEDILEGIKPKKTRNKKQEIFDKFRTAK
jgi:hypothetical protein